jgi:hypothetical protein
LVKYIGKFIAVNAADKAKATKMDRAVKLDKANEAIVANKTGVLDELAVADKANDELDELVPHCTAIHTTLPWQYHVR